MSRRRSSRSATRFSGSHLAVRSMLMALGVVAAAALLLEAGLRFHPALLPARLQLECMRWRFKADVLTGDAEMGVVMPAPLERQGGWKNKTVLLRHVLFPGESSVGYRGGAEGGDPTKVDIAVLGDSHVYNLEIDEKATWLSLLSRRTGRSVANLALPYQGTAQEFLWYRRYGVRLHPKLVLMTLCPNDLGDNKVFHDWAAQRDAGEADFQYYRFRVMLGWPEPLPRLALWANKSILLQQLLLRPRMSRNYADFLEAAGGPPEAMEMLVADVAKTRALAAEGGGRFAVVLTDIWWGGWMAPWAERLKTDLRSQGIPVLDLTEKMCSPIGCSDRYRLPDDLHWNNRGQAKVADEVRDFLRRERLLP